MYEVLGRCDEQLLTTRIGDPRLTRVASRIWEQGKKNALPLHGSLNGVKLEPIPNAKARSNVRRRRFLHKPEPGLLQKHRER